jgi:amino acid adenylation domain-containing protein
MLLDNDYEIRSIISSDTAVKGWAKKRQILHVEPSADLPELFDQQPFDYLFSIVNEHILPENVLRLPRKLAINYHDSLLPRYAGTHATSWALMNRETDHGVTWHLMSTVVDAGDILKQQSVQIAEGDTVLTLNTKCYEAAINSFAQLIAELSSGSVVGRKQNLNERTFFGRYKRPATGCVISWSRSSSHICALLRALNFGSYLNPLGTPKLAINNDFVIIPEIDVLSTSDTPPGTIIKIGSDYMQVSTADREVVLRSVLTLDGEPISIPDLVERYGLREGHTFEDLDSETAKHLESLYAANCRHEAFWVKRLASLKPAVIAYQNINAGSTEARRYTSMPMFVPNEIADFLRRQIDCSMSDFLLAAFAAFIARVGGTNSFDIAYSDLLLKSELVRVDKLFATHLPLRIDIDCSQSFKGILKTVKKQLDCVRSNKTFARDLVSRYPQLRSISESGGKFTLPFGVEIVERLNQHEIPPGSEIMLNISANGSECCWAYDRNKLEADRVLKLIHYFTTFTKGIIANSEQQLAYLPLITEAERHQLLIEWNDTQAEYPRYECVHQLIEEQAARTPDAVALTFGQRHLTYLELNHQANQLAHFLRASGAGPEVPIAICVERSLEMVIGLLGVIKAGAAYVPLDPLYPNERLAFMLSDSEPLLLLTQRRLVSLFKRGAPRIVCLDTDWKLIAEESELNPVTQVTPENLAYIIYTSGSTGHPKGVLIPHRSLASHSVGAAKHYELKASDRVLQLASISFDVAAEEIFPTLLTGAAVVLLNEPTSPPIANFIALLEKARVTVINLPSYYWHELVLELDRMPVPLPATLRLVVTGSERVLPERLIIWRKLFGDSIRWLNAYGPTEATVTATIYEPGDELHETATVPIGRPMANRQIYILDSYRNPVPVGVPGELHIGGDGLARGYLNLPELTREKFVRNPFDQQPDARLYRTGDLGCYQPDGNIEFLGRLDNQVKLRGFRIELGEIEMVLNGNPLIKKSVVVAREDKPGEKRLVAYVVLWEEVDTIVSDLRRWVKQQLPDYMLPSAFVVLDELPLTTSGEPDRRALPVPESKQFVENAFVAPRNTLELLLTKTWERVLDVRPIGVRDNFFDLGGESMLAVRLFAQIEKMCGKKLPLPTLFQAATVEQLANLLSEDAWCPTWSSLVPIQPGGSKPPLFCLHLALGHVLFYRDLARRLGSDQPVYAFQPQGLDGTQPRHTRIEEMAAHYIKEMRSLQPEGPYYLAGASFGGLMAFEMAQQLQTQGQDVGMLAFFDTYAPGFHKLSNGGGSLRYKVYRVMQRVDLHLGNLLWLGPEEKLKYAREKTVIVGRRVKWGIKTRVESGLKKIAEKWYQANGHSDDGEYEERLINDYVPKVYPGCVTLFRASKQPAGYNNDCDLGWNKFAAGGVEILEVPGYHGSIVTEPRVRILAEQLEICLSTAYHRPASINHRHHRL